MKARAKTPPRDARARTTVLGPPFFVLFSPGGGVEELAEDEVAVGGLGVDEG